MRRLCAVLASSVLFLASLAGQTTRVPGFSVRDARSLGMGGSFQAVSEGSRSLYGNPAGYYNQDAELSILSPASWIYATGLGSALEAAGGDEDAVRALLAENGFGFGYHLGIGYAGKGLGLGFFLTQDSFSGKQAAADLDGVEMETDFQANVVVGLALPVRVFGLNVIVGGNLRPFFQARGTLPLSDALEAMSGFSPGVFFRQEGVGGFGLAVDLGALLELGAFTVGLSARDLAPPFSADSGQIRELLGSFGGGSDELSLSPTFAAGVQFHPDLGGAARFFDPRVLAEVRLPVSEIRDGGSFPDFLHLGAEAKFLSFLSLRAGFNGARFCAGAGLDLFFLEVNAAVFSEEHGGAERRGIVLEAAIRL